MQYMVGLIKSIMCGHYGCVSLHNCMCILMSSVRVNVSKHLCVCMCEYSQVPYVQLELFIYIVVKVAVN